VLTFSQDEAALELIGQLPRAQSAPDPETGEVTVPAGLLPRERILGLSTDGKSFTLERCLPTGWGFGGIVTEQFAPAVILEGAHYAEGEAVLFDELLVQYTQLDAWVATSGLTLEFESESETIAGINIAFRPPEPVTVQLADFKFEVDFRWTLKHPAPLGTAVDLAQHAALTLAFAKPAPLERCFDLVYQLRNFIALGVGRPVTPTTVRGTVLRPHGVEREFGERQPPRLGMNIFFRLPDVPEVRQAHPAEMLFTLADARDRFAQLVENWFGKQELLRPVFDLYFGAIYNRQAFLEQRFLSLMQAIETFHRRTSTETELPPTDHERRLEEILTAAPEMHRDWLSGKLTYSNELTLRKRLSDVLGRCPKVVSKLVKKKSFIHQVYTARNYLTHYDQALEAEAPKGLDLYPLTVQLQALVEMCLFLELGFDCAEVDGFFERVGRYREAHA
jgi:hypothetical protein